MPAAHRFVHAEVIEIQGLAVLQQAVVFHLRYLAERVAAHLTVIIHKDRLRFVAEQRLQFLLAVLGGVGLEQFGPQTVMHHIHLMQQIDELRDIRY